MRSDRRVFRIAPSGRVAAIVTLPVAPRVIAFAGGARLGDRAARRRRRAHRPGDEPGRRARRASGGPRRARGRRPAASGSRTRSTAGVAGSTRARAGSWRRSTSTGTPTRSRPPATTLWVTSDARLSGARSRPRSLAAVAALSRRGAAAPSASPSASACCVECSGLLVAVARRGRSPPPRSRSSSAAARRGTAPSSVYGRSVGGRRVELVPACTEFTYLHRLDPRDAPARRGRRRRRRDRADRERRERRVPRPGARFPDVTFLASDDGRAGDDAARPAAQPVPLRRRRRAERRPGSATYAYRDLGWRRAVVVAEDWYPGWESAAGFVAEFCALGGNVVERDWYVALRLRTRRAAARRHAAKADGVLVIATFATPARLSHGVPGERRSRAPRAAARSAVPRSPTRRASQPPGVDLTGVVIGGYIPLAPAVGGDAASTRSVRAAIPGAARRASARDRSRSPPTRPSRRCSPRSSRPGASSAAARRRCARRCAASCSTRPGGRPARPEPAGIERDLPRADRARGARARLDGRGRPHGSTASSRPSAASSRATTPSAVADRPDLRARPAAALGRLSSAGDRPGEAGLAAERGASPPGRSPRRTRSVGWCGDVASAVRARPTPSRRQRSVRPTTTRPALRAASTSDCGVGLDEQRLGMDAERALHGERRAREQPARVATVRARRRSGQHEPVAGARASHAPSSTAAQSCSAPANGTSTGPGREPRRRRARRRRTAPRRGGARSRASSSSRVGRVDEQQLGILLAGEPREVGAGRERRERRGADRRCRRRRGARGASRSRGDAAASAPASATVEAMTSSRSPSRASGSASATSESTGVEVEGRDEERVRRRRGVARSRAGQVERRVVAQDRAARAPGAPRPARARARRRAARASTR